MVPDSSRDMDRRGQNLHANLMREGKAHIGIIHRALKEKVQILKKLKHLSFM